VAGWFVGPEEPLHRLSRYGSADLDRLLTLGARFAAEKERLSGGSFSLRCFAVAERGDCMLGGRLRRLSWQLPALSARPADPDFEAYAAGAA